MVHMVHDIQLDKFINGYTTSQVPKKVSYKKWIHFRFTCTLLIKHAGSSFKRTCTPQKAIAGIIAEKSHIKMFSECYPYLFLLTWFLSKNQWCWWMQEITCSYKHVSHSSLSKQHYTE